MEFHNLSLELESTCNGWDDAKERKKRKVQDVMKNNEYDSYEMILAG